MSGFMRKTALVVGAVALIAATAGAAAVALAPAMAGTAGVAGVSAATLTAIGTYGGLASGVLSAISVATAPKASNQGSATTFQTNPQSGLPYAIGRTRMSGLRMFAATNTRPGYTKFNDLLWFGALLSIGGQIGGIEKFTIDNEIVTFDASGNAVGAYHDYQGQKIHLGGAPMASGLALSLGGGAAPGWTSQHKLSGITHAMWCLRYNKQGEMYGAGAPEPAWIGKWVRVYDPRLDSTYPGGSGACRALNESTYVWSDNPALHALTWALGRVQNGKRTCGIGAPIANIRVAEFVECANVCEANSWTAGGVEWTTDSKWDTLKRMLQAGGARPTQTGAMIGCLVSMPRTAIATIESWHLLDSLSIAATKSRRDRFNSVIPRYVDEDSDWSMISGTVVSVPEYVSADGGARTKEIDYPLVQVFSGQVAMQPGQLAAYDIVNSREAGPINFTTGPEWIGLKTGDVVLLNVPEEGLVNQPVLITRRAPDPSTGKVSFSAETETYSKHAYALGQSTTPPAPFSLTAPDLKPPAPVAASWAAVGSITGEGLPAIVVTGNADMPSADAVVIDYRRSGVDEWTRAVIVSANDPVRHVISPLESAAAYDVRVGYRVGEIDGDFVILYAVTGEGKLSGIEDGATNGASQAEKDLLAQLEQDTATAATNIAAAQAQIAAIEGSVSADFAALNASVSTLNSEVDAVQGNIASLQSSTGALQQSVTSLNGQVVQAQSDIVTITSTVSGLSGQIGTLSSNLSSLTAEVGTVSGTVSGLTSQVGTINVDISALTTRIAGAEGQISATSSTVATQGGLIEQNAQAISNVAGNLATLTMRVSASNSNLLPNGGLADGFASGVTSWGAFSYDNSQFWGPIAVTSQPGTQVFSFAAVPSNPGSTYTISCDPIAYTADKLAYVDIIFQDANGQNLYDGPQNPQYGPFDFSGSNTRRGAIAVSATAPPGTAKMVARFVGDGSGAGPVGFRRMKLEHGDQWTAFSDEASIVQTFLAISTANENIAQLTTTVGAQGATITQQATAISNLQGTTASLSSTVQTQGGQISNLQTVTTTQGGTIAQHTTDISTANANISTNATAISTANGNIANLTTRVGSAEAAITTNATAISNVTGRTATLESTVSTQGASISSLQTATSTISGNLASLTTRVAASSPNLLPNGGLENGFNSGVSDTGGFNFIIGGWGPTATTNANGIHVFQFTPVTEVQINAKYTFAVDPLNLGTSDLFANILCLNSAGQVILDPPGGFTPSAGDFSSNDTRRALMACTITVPAGTVSLLCRVYGTVRDNQYIGFRRAKLERGPTWTAYTTEASVVQTWTAISTATGSLAALTTRVGTAEGSISTAQTAISNLQGTTASLTSTVQTQGGQISNLQSVTTTQGGTIAQHTTDIATANANISTNATAISTLNGSVATLTNRVAASGSNLLPNGGLANGFASGVGTTGTFGFDNSQFWGPIAVTGQPGTQVFTFAPVPANPGSVYTLHCDPIAYQVGCLAFVDILFRNSAGQVIYDGPQNAQTGPFDFSENNARRASIAVSAQAPAGAVDMVARFVGEVANGGPVGFRRMKLEHGANWTSFSDEASVVQTFSALSNLGTSYAALETRVSSAEGSVSTLQSTLTSATGSISTLQTNVASLNGSVSTLQQSSSTHDGQISTLQTTVSAQGTAISSNATAISTVQGSLATLTTRVNANQPNLLNNGGLENGFAGIASSTANWSWNNTAEWGPVAATTTNGTQVIQFADITAVQPGATYWMHCDPIAYGSSTIYCDLLFYDGAGNMLLDGPQNRQDGQFNFSPDDTRRGMIAVSAVAPSGTAIIKPRVVANVVGNQIAGFRRIKVETGPTWSRFSSEASVMQQFQAISTLNTSYSSLSTTVSSQGGQVDNLQTAFTGLNGTVATLQTTVSAQGSNISTLQTAQSTQSGQITTLQTKLVSGGGNLLQNSDFAVDMTFWGFNQQGSAHTGGRDFLGDNYRPANEHVASIYHSNNNPADYAYWSSQLVAVEQDKFYEFSVGAANSRAGVLIYLRFLYGDSSIAADFTAAKSYYSEGNNLVNFPTIYARGKAPPGVYWVQCLMLKFGTDAGQSDSYAWFVRPQLVEVPGLTGGPVAYSPGGTSAVISVQAQAISSATGQLSTLQSTVQAQGAQVNNLQTAYSGLNGTVATLQSTVSANGAAISTLQSTTSTLQGNVATLTTRVSAAGTNLLPNGGLENGFNTGIGDPGGFNFTSGAWGPHALTTANGLRVFQFSPVGSIQVGADYTFAVDPLNYGASDLYCNMILVDSSGGVILDVPARSPQSPGDFSGNDVRRSQVACTATIPAGTASIVCRVYGTVRDGQPLGFRRAKLERGSTWTPYSAEATIVQQYQTLSTLNTQYASLSSTVQTQGVAVSTHSTAITTLNGNVATLFGQYVLEVVAGGVVAGMKLANNAGSTSIKFKSDVVEFTGSSTTERFEMRQGTMFGYDASGRKRYQIGNRSLV